VQAWPCPEAPVQPSARCTAYNPSRAAQAALSQHPAGIVSVMAALPTHNGGGANPRTGDCLRPRPTIADAGARSGHLICSPTTAFAADSDPDAARTTWDLVRRSGERASRLPSFTHAASAAASGAPEAPVVRIGQVSLDVARRSTNNPLMPRTGLFHSLAVQHPCGGRWPGTRQSRELKF
jgi:hypothetical protein